MKQLIRSLLASLPALLVYLGALPWAALRLDRRLGLAWRLPLWMDVVGAVFVVAGALLAVWSFWALTFRGGGTPNPMVATTHLVEGEPFRRSRNPLMLGGWLCGAGLACLLRSPSLLGGVGLVVVAGVLYVRWIEEPGLAARFGVAWTKYAARTPRWLLLAVVVASCLAAAPALTVEPAPSHLTSPAILVQIRCKPGMAGRWRGDFNQHIRPAIEEVIARGGSFTGFQLMQPALPWQSFDFVLLYSGASFASLDQPRLFPHYQALLEREGPLRTMSIVREMDSYEDQASVTLVHLTTAR
jgi:protein-S-isoprenylcysteine O-methyltransferase Ste14